MTLSGLSINGPALKLKREKTVNSVEKSGTRSPNRHLNVSLLVFQALGEDAPFPRLPHYTFTAFLLPVLQL